jgi:hypothetical protein
LWLDTFRYKNSATPLTKADGFYLDRAVKIESTKAIELLRGLTLGMETITSKLAAELDAIIAEPANKACAFV